MTASKINKIKNIIIFIFFSQIYVLISLGCSKNQKLEVKNLYITKTDGKKIYLKTEIASTYDERKNGLMGRKNIPEGTGMLFIFENDQILSFWMKNTPSPLSIAFITSDGMIKDIFDMMPFSLAEVKSTGYRRYALEVPQGWFKKENIDIGSYISLDGI